MIRLVYAGPDTAGLPPALRQEWDRLCGAEHVVRHAQDAQALVERFEDSEEELLVVGGLSTLARFLPHATHIDVLEAEQAQLGDLRFDVWDTPRFALQDIQAWAGGRTLRLQRQPVGLQNAVSLYEEGIRDGQVDAVARYSGARYTQHSTGVMDGVEGFEAFFKEFLIRNPERDIRVLRAFQDGPFVFMQVSQSLAQGETQWVTMDLFETDPDGQIVEHWDVIEAWSENCQVDGESQVRGMDPTQANKALVRTMLTEVFVYNRLSRFEEFVASDVVVHRPSFEPGRAAWADAVREAGETYDFVHRLAGQGNFVMAYSRVRTAEGDQAVFDLFRVEAGKVAEAWRTAEPVVSLDVAKNIGKF